MYGKMYLSIHRLGKGADQKNQSSQPRVLSCFGNPEGKPRGETPKLSGSGVGWGVGMKAAQRTGYFSWALKDKCQLLSKWEWGVVGVQDEKRGTQGKKKKKSYMQMPRDIVYLETICILVWLVSRRNKAKQS